MKFVGVLLFSLFFQGAFASDQCSSTLKTSSFYQTEAKTESISQLEVSERFIAYIKSLHQAGALSLDKLILLREELKANSNVYSLLSSDSNNPELVLTAHLPMLAEYLKDDVLDKKSVAKILTAYVEFVGEQVVERGQISDETNLPFDKMKFGSYTFRPIEYLGDNSRYEEPRNDLKHTIALASTPVTQGQWVEVMGENPSRLSEGADSVVARVNGLDVSLRPEHPVTNVTIWAMMEFANRMSIRDGLEPAYRLNYERFEGRAEDGTLNAKREYENTNRILPRGVFAEKPIRKFVKANQIFFDIHKTQGYRLPSYSEWMFIATNGGEVEYPASLVSSRNSWISFVLQQGDWLKTVGGVTTKIRRTETTEVGTLEKNFVTADGQKIYDIFGNVQTIVTDKMLTKSDPPFWRLGWAFTDRLEGIAKGEHSAFRHKFNGSTKSSFVGFRLVRTLSKKEAKQ